MAAYVADGVEAVPMASALPDKAGSMPAFWKAAVKAALWTLKKMEERSNL